MKHFVTMGILLISLGACTNLTTKFSQTKNKAEKMKLSNKEKAEALLVSLETGDQTPVSYINPDKYIQHNLAVGDGLEGFGEVLKNAPAGGFRTNVVRSYQDGDYVFTHTIYDFFGPKVGFDVFRFEGGKIVEHWDNLLEIAPPNPSGHTQTDGPTKSSDLDKTLANKKIVSNFISDILINGRMDKIPSYIDADEENYIQHNPAIGDGLSGLGAALEGMAKQGITMEYKTVHKVLGEGNFVLAISEGAFAGKPTSYYDLFRVENEKIVEHWDVMETIMPEAEWKNSNGKFNFPK